MQNKNRDGIVSKLALVATAAMLWFATLQPTADAASLYQTSFARFPDEIEATTSQNLETLAEIPFTVRGGGGDFLIEPTVTLFLINDNLESHYLGYEIRLEVDGQPLPDYGVSELGFNTLDAMPVTQVVQTSFKSAAFGLAAGSHMLTVTWLSYDPDCTVQAGPNESTVVISRM